MLGWYACPLPVGLNQELSQCTLAGYWQQPGCVEEGLLGKSCKHIIDDCKIAFDLGNKICKLILAQIIAQLNAPPEVCTRVLAKAGMSSQGWDWSLSIGLRAPVGLLENPAPFLASL